MVTFEIKKPNSTYKGYKYYKTIREEIGNAIQSANNKSIANKIITAVSDNGIGIEGDIFYKLFRIDEQVSTAGTLGESGSGLGLILCKEFVEKKRW